MSEKEFKNDADKAYHFFAAPETFGELKKVIAEIPDNCPLQWLNQPKQMIYKRSLSKEEIDATGLRAYFVFQ